MRRAVWAPRKETSPPGHAIRRSPARFPRPGATAPGPVRRPPPPSAYFAGVWVRAGRGRRVRGLLFRLSDGELVGPWVDKFAWPFRWFYSALNALDYFRGSALHAGTGPDPRLTQAIDVVLGDRTDDGTWIQGRRHPGEVWIEVDVDAGEPSKWLTFYATRVLNWWASAGRWAYCARPYRRSPASPRPGTI